MDKLEPGRELAALIAEKVMGLNVQHSPETSGGSGKAGSTAYLGSKIVYYDEPKGSVVRGFGKDIPAYSTDIAAAWRVVEKISSDNLIIIRLGVNRSIQEAGTTFVTVNADSVQGVSAPHAICLAALKAIGHRSAS